jgi:hypothetical protein
MPLETGKISAIRLSLRENIPVFLKEIMDI